MSGVQAENSNIGMESGTYQEVVHSSVRTQGSGITATLPISTPHPGQQSSPFTAMNVPHSESIPRRSNAAAGLPQLFCAVPAFQNNSAVPPVQTTFVQAPQVAISQQSASPPSVFQQSQVQCHRGNQVLGDKSNNPSFVTPPKDMTVPHMQAMQQQFTQPPNILIGNMSQLSHPMQLQATCNQVNMASQCRTPLVQASGQHFSMNGTNSPVYALPSGTGLPIVVMPSQNAMVMSPLSTAGASPLANNISTGSQQGQGIGMIGQQFQTFCSPTQGLTPNIAAVSPMQLQSVTPVVQQVRQVDGLVPQSVQAVSGNQLMAIAQSNFATNGQDVPVTGTHGTQAAVQQPSMPAVIGNQQQHTGPVLVQPGASSSPQRSQLVNALQIPSVCSGQDTNPRSATKDVLLNSTPNRICETPEAFQANQQPIQPTRKQLNVTKNPQSSQSGKPPSISCSNLAPPSSRFRPRPSKHSNNGSTATDRQVGQHLQHLLADLRQTQDSPATGQEDKLPELPEVLSLSGLPNASCNELVPSSRFPSIENLPVSSSFSTGRRGSLERADSSTVPSQDVDSQRNAKKPAKDCASPESSQELEGPHPNEPEQITSIALSTLGNTELPGDDIVSFPLDERNLSDFLGLPSEDEDALLERELRLISSIVNENDDNCMETENTRNENVANISRIRQPQQANSNAIQLISKNHKGGGETSKEKKARSENRGHNHCNSESNQTTTSNGSELISSDANVNGVITTERTKVHNEEGSPSLCVPQMTTTNTNDISLNSPSSDGPIQVVGRPQETRCSPGTISEKCSPKAMEAWESYFEYDWTKIGTTERRKRRAYIVNRKRLPASERKMVKTMRNGEQTISFRTLTNDEAMGIGKLYPRMAPHRKEKKVRNRIVAQRGRERKKKTAENLTKENEKLRSHCSSLQADNAQLQEAKAENARLKDCLDKLLNSNPSLHSRFLSEN